MDDEVVEEFRNYKTQLGEELLNDLSESDMYCQPTMSTTTFFDEDQFYLSEEENFLKLAALNQLMNHYREAENILKTCFPLNQRNLTLEFENRFLALTKAGIHKFVAFDLAESFGSIDEAIEALETEPQIIISEDYKGYDLDIYETYDIELYETY